MQEMYQICKDIIAGTEIKDEKTQEILTISLLAISCLNKSFVTERLPEIVRKTSIYAEEDTLINIVKNHCYEVNPNLADSDTAIETCFTYTKENPSVQVRNYLFLSIQNKDFVSLVEKTIYGLLHLLRQGVAHVSGNRAYMVKGISINYIDLDTKEVIRRNASLEEGIVEYYTEIAMKSLENRLDNENPSIKSLQTFKMQMKLYSFPTNNYEKMIIAYLVNFPSLNTSLEETFSEENSYPSSFIQNFNSLVESSSSFMKFSRNVDRMANYIHDHDGDSSIVDWTHNNIIETIHSLKKKLPHENSE